MVFINLVIQYFPFLLDAYPDNSSWWNLTDLITLLKPFKIIPIVISGINSSFEHIMIICLCWSMFFWDSMDTLIHSPVIPPPRRILREVPRQLLNHSLVNGWSSPVVLWLIEESSILVNLCLAILCMPCNITIYKEWKWMI